MKENVQNQDLDGFPFMNHEGKCSKYQDFDGFPFVDPEGKCSKSRFGWIPLCES